METRKILRLGLILVSVAALVMVSGCAPVGGTEEGGLSNIILLVFMVLVLVLMFFMMNRRQRKAQKERQGLKAGLRKGDRVITAAGVYGEIESISEASVVLKIESGATLRVTKDSITGRQ